METHMVGLLAGDYNATNNSTVYFQVGPVFLARTPNYVSAISWYKYNGNSFIKIANFYPDYGKIYFIELATEEVQKFIEAYETINK